VWVNDPVRRVLTFLIIAGETERAEKSEGRAQVRSYQVVHTVFVDLQIVNLLDPKILFYYHFNHSNKGKNPDDRQKKTLVVLELCVE
jgi:hypothetical protein